MRVHHIGFLTKNMEKATERFLALGFETERPSCPDPVRGVHIAFMKNGGYRVELICPDSKASPMYPLLAHYRNTPYHLCYMVEDLAQAMEALSGEGYTVFDAPKEAPCIDGHPVAFLLHRDIGIIELLECERDPWS